MSYLLRAPFPYFGAKRREAARVWSHLGSPLVYAEPFAGSLSVLLARPGGPGWREIVGDLDGGVCNFWRAVTYAADDVAEHADYPCIHHDLQARHKWYREWVKENAGRLIEDPGFYDAKAAGWWVWGMSETIASDWLSEKMRSIPAVLSVAGVSHRKRRRPDLVRWFRAIQCRMKKVVVLNRSWEFALSDAILTRVSMRKRRSVGVFLDPPYVAEGRASVYQSDKDKTSTSVATASYEWALEHGDEYRIGYCCHAGDFEVPDGWELSRSTMTGARKGKGRSTQQDIMFSPACRKRIKGFFPGLGK